MHGLFHMCIKRYILQEYGKSTWTEIAERAQVDKHLAFLFSCNYSDADTMRVLKAAMHVLQTESKDLLERVGEFFVDFSFETGYSEMLASLGHTLEDFLNNLDFLHCYLMEKGFGGTSMPSFSCSRSEGQPDSLTVHYYSTRERLHHLVPGIIRRCAEKLFNLHVNVLISADSPRLERIRPDLTVHHSRFQVVEGCQEGTTPPQRSLSLARSPNRLSAVHHPRRSVVHTTYVTNDVLESVHPYHVVFDRGMQVRHFGRGIATLCPGVDVLRPLTDYFQLLWPYAALTYSNFERFRNSVFRLRVTGGTAATNGTCLNGQVAFVGGEQVLFLGMVSVASMEELRAASLRISDLPALARDLLFLQQQRNSEAELARRLERARAQLELEKERADRLLANMLPQPVADQLKLGQRVQPTTHEHVTVLFSDVVSFTPLTSQCSPQQLMHMLGQMYDVFDEASERNHVYKLETIGDAYMVASGLPTPVADHAERVLRQARDMIHSVADIKNPHTGKPIQIRVGVHTGRVIAGVVGRKVPKYCIYGDTVNVAARMESNSEPGRVHISDTCRQELQLEGVAYTLEPRGGIMIKGKGNMDTYFVNFDEMCSDD